jgi:hypothetical protein
MSRPMADDFDDVDRARRAEHAGLELTRGTDFTRSGYIDIRGLVEIAHLADDRLLALAGMPERMLPADSFAELVRAYLLEEEKPSVEGDFGLARGKLLVGIVDGLREFTKQR